MKKLEIPYEIADGITLATLQDQYKYLMEETRLHVQEGKYLHREDYLHNMELIPALQLLIKYFGGDSSDPLEQRDRYNLPFILVWSIIVV